MFDEKLIFHNTPRDFVSIIFRHRRKVIYFFVVVIIATTFKTLLTQSRYETEAKLFVRLGNETVNWDSASGSRIQISQSIESQLNSEIEILRSRELAEAVVTGMGKENIIGEGNGEDNSLFVRFQKTVNAVLSFPKKALVRLFSPAINDENERRRREIDEAVQKFQGSFNASVVAGSNVVTLTYEDDSPRRAYKVLKQLIDIYLHKHIVLNGTPGSFEFFKKESDQLRQQLESTEAELKDAKNRMGVSALEEQRTILSEQIGVLQQKMEETESSAASSQARIRELEGRLKNVPENVIVSETTGFAQSAAEEMQRRLNDLKMQEQELLSTFTPSSVPVTEVRRQIKQAESLLQNSRSSREVTTGVNHMHQEIKTSLLLENGTVEALKAQQVALRSQLEASEQKMRFLNDAETRLSQLMRRKALLEENYAKYAGSLEQVRIDKAREIDKISNISVAQAPVVPIEPVRPKKMLYMAMGFFLAVFGGLGLAFFMEYIDSTFRRPEEVENLLELPVLGSVPKLEG